MKSISKHSSLPPPSLPPSLTRRVAVSAEPVSLHVQNLPDLIVCAFVDAAFMRGGFGEELLDLVLYSPNPECCFLEEEEEYIVCVREGKRRMGRCEQGKKGG